MKKELQELFNGLNTLCETNEAFYYSEQDYDENHTIRSYSYRLASWTDFQVPFAKDSRGTAFVLDKRTGKWDLFARAYKKFHNLNEGISKEEYIRDNNPLCSYEKLDGSLILVGRIEGKLIAKSKTSINSDHAKRAQELIQENEVLIKYLNNKIDNGFTPVMELVGPGDFRVVLPYKKDELIWLGAVQWVNYKVQTIQNNQDNENSETSETFKKEAGIRCASAYHLSWDELLEIQENHKPSIEGYVVRTESGFVKVKVQSYVQLHTAKSSINNLKMLIQLVLDDNLDDLMGLLQDDKDIIDYIIKIQTIIAHKYNHLVAQFLELRRKYFQEFSENRKEFAISYSKEPLFGGVMKTLNIPSTDIEQLEQVARKHVRLYIDKVTNTLEKAKAWVG